jgi:opacity protein-like surface antigen
VVRIDRKDDVMSGFRMLALAGAGLAVSAANAADLGPPPQILPAAPFIHEFSGWYLRGDIGMSNQRLRALTNPDPNAQGFSAGMGFDSASIFGGGIGYQFNDWLRVDATGEYRGRANFHGSQFLSGPGFASADNYSGSKSETLALFNAYADLGTWWSITPFIGAGIGASRNTISSFRDDGVHTAFGAAQAATVTYATNNGRWNMAWDLTAGLAYKVTPGFTVELAYRYLNLGSATTGLPNSSFNGSFTPPQYPWTMKNLT